MKEVAEIIKSSWNDFKDWYDERCDTYVKSEIDNGWNAEDAVKDRWVCWREKDLVLHLSRFIYQRSPDLDVHMEFEMKHQNFDGKFSKSVERAQEKFARRSGKKKVIPDMIICWHDEQPFSAAVESKMFRGQEGIALRYGRSWEEDVRKDIETLRVLLEEHICADAFLMVLDDYYWFNDAEKSKQLEKTIRELPKGIDALYHKSTIKRKFIKQ